jgi:hypothetical protein
MTPNTCSGLAPLSQLPVSLLVDAVDISSYYWLYLDRTDLTCEFNRITFLLRIYPEVVALLV